MKVKLAPELQKGVRDPCYNYFLEKSMKKLDEIRKTLHEKREILGSRYKVKELLVFGSNARNEQNENSDIDFIVDFKKGFKTFDMYMDLKFYLEELLGRKVDLILRSALKEDLKKLVLKEAVNV